MIISRQIRRTGAAIAFVALASCSLLTPQPTRQERQALCDKLDTLKTEDYAKVEMHPVQRSELNQALRKSVYKVLDQYDAPKKDGKSYYGEIKIDLDEEGIILKTVVSKPSGSSVLDQAMLDAANNAKQLELPEDRCVARMMTGLRTVLSYTDEDMK